jgi:hypothetical protein
MMSNSVSHSSQKAHRGDPDRDQPASGAVDGEHIGIGAGGGDRDSGFLNNGLGSMAASVEHCTERMSLETRHFKLCVYLAH